MKIIADQVGPRRFHFVVVDRTNKRFPFNRSGHTWATKRAALAAGNREFALPILRAATREAKSNEQ